MQPKRERKALISSVGTFDLNAYCAADVTNGEQTSTEERHLIGHNLGCKSSIILSRGIGEHYSQMKPTRWYSIQTENKEQQFVSNMHLGTYDAVKFSRPFT